MTSLSLERRSLPRVSRVSAFQAQHLRSSSSSLVDAVSIRLAAALALRDSVRVSCAPTTGVVVVSHHRFAAGRSLKPTLLGLGSGSAPGLVLGGDDDMLPGTFDQALISVGSFGRGWLRLQRHRRRAWLVAVDAGDGFQPWQAWAEVGVFGPGPGLNLVRVGFDGPWASSGFGLQTLEDMMGGLAVPTPTE